MTFIEAAKQLKERPFRYGEFSGDFDIATLGNTGIVACEHGKLYFFDLRTDYKVKKVNYFPVDTAVLSVEEVLSENWKIE